MATLFTKYKLIVTQMVKISPKLCLASYLTPLHHKTINFLYNKAFKPIQFQNKNSRYNLKLDLRKLEE